MDLFSLSVALAKQSVKQMAKEQLKNLALDAVKQTMPKKYISDQFVFYKSSRTINSTVGQYKDSIRVAERLADMSKAQKYSSLDRTYKPYKSFGETIERMKDRSDKQFIRDTKIRNLNDFDLDLFMKAQFNSKKGSLSIDDLIKDPKIYEQCPLRYRIKENVYFNIDRVIGNNITDGKIDLQGLEKSSNREFYERIKERVEELSEKGLIKNLNGVYHPTAEYSEAIRKINSTYNDLDYKIFKTCEKGISVDEFKGQFSKSVDHFNASKRLDQLINEGSLKLENDRLTVTDKFKLSHKDYVGYLQSNAKTFLENKLDVFEKMGLVNKNGNLYDVTDLYYKNFKAISDSKNYMGTYFDDRLVNHIDPSIPLSEVKNRFVSGSFDEEYMNLRFNESLNSLKEKGLIRVDLENDSIELLSKVKTKDTSIDFSFYDVNLYRKFQDQSMSMSNFEKLNTSERRRIYRHVQEGLMEIKNDSLHLTEKGIAFKNDYLKEVKLSKAMDNFKLDKVTEYLASKKSFTIDDLTKDEHILKAYDYLNKRQDSFSFTKYDANVILRDFETPKSLMEYKQIIQNGISELNVESEFKRRSARIDKLLEHGYLIADDKAVISITRGGLEAKQALKGFSFTEYDTNVLFKQIQSHDGKINKTQLADALSKEYKGSELAKQIEYNIRRLQSNVEYGTVSFDGTHYSITNKGYDMQEAIRRSKIAHVEKAVVSKLEYLEYLDFVKSKDGVYSFTPTFERQMNLRAFDVSKLDVNIYNRLSEGKQIDIKELSKEFSERYNEKGAARQQAIYSGRLNKLDEIGLVYNQDGIYKATEKFHDVMREYERFKSIDDPKISEIVSLEFKNQGTINNFTFNNVTNVIEGNHWTMDDHLKKFNDAQLTDRTEKHLEQLSKIGYAYKVDNGYLVHDELLERSRLLELPKDRRFTDNQLKFLVDVRDFQSLSHSQANKYIFENDKLATYNLNELVKRGIIDFKVKNIDGEAEKIYYLKSQGKKALLEITGEDKQVFDSKVLRRPQEIKHDLYVYSAYKDYQSILDQQNMRIVDVKTDKDIRSLLNSGKLHNSISASHTTEIKIDFADLYIEFENADTLERGYVNIEVDVGYTKDVIKSKCDKIDNLVWYTDSSKQMQRIQSVSQTAMIKTISL